MRNWPKGNEAGNMGRDTDILDRLLEKPCYIMDVLPRQVERDAGGSFFDDPETDVLLPRGRAVGRLGGQAVAGGY